ncbi:MAG: hypothetical protein OXC65_16665 [Thiotrichales bacterium]|nr:hypothetical protein [Thiotrichales bacterium]
MPSTGFDTLTAARELETAGVERPQAEAIAAQLRAAASADRDELATKADLAVFATKGDLTVLEVRMVKWAIGLAFAGSAVVLVGVRLMLGSGSG